MNIPETYDYLVRARRDLWAALNRVPDEVFSRPLLSGERFHCIKDLVFHVASVEDFWIQEEILREQPVRKTIPALKDTQGGPIYAGFAVDTLLNYSRIERMVSVHDRPGKRYTVEWSAVERDDSRGATRGTD
jgi:DinB family